MHATITIQRDQCTFQLDQPNGKRNHIARPITIRSINHTRNRRSRTLRQPDQTTISKPNESKQIKDGGKICDDWERPLGKKCSAPRRCRRGRRWQRRWGAGLGRRFRTSDGHLRMSATTFSLFFSLEDEDDGGGCSSGSAVGFDFALSIFSFDFK